MDVVSSIEKRVQWIRDLLAKTGAKGIIYGNSGGKDCTLVGALCKSATPNVLGVIMPCQSSQNYGSDRDDALRAGERFGIEQIEIDLSATKQALLDAFGEQLTNNNAGESNLKMASVNINPRLRMTALYALGQARGYLVAGTGNLDEATLGYFTKWGDGAYDFNPIGDLTVTEIYESAREKIADCLVNGKRLVISGGNYRLCEGKTCGCGCGCTDCRCGCCRTEK